MPTAFEAQQTNWDGSLMPASRSTGYMNLVSGDWEFDGLDHQARVATIHTIVNLMEGLLKTGWIEHTNDWDWFATVTYGPNNAKLGEDWDTLADDLALDQPDDLKWSEAVNLKVLVDETEVLVPIAEIHQIHIEQA